MSVASAKYKSCAAAQCTVMLMLSVELQAYFMTCLYKRGALDVQTEYTLQATNMNTVLYIPVHCRPIYLLFNTTGRNTGGKWANHINPYSPIFSKREHTEVVVSSAALVLACSGLYAIAARFGWLWLVKVRSCTNRFGRLCFATVSWLDSQGQRFNCMSAFVDHACKRFAPTHSLSTFEP